MKKYDYIEKQVVKKEPCIEYLICDICDTLIKKSNIGNRVKSNNLVEWYFVRTGHNDWGNDSCDSVESFEVCPECLNKVFHEYFKRSTGRNSEYMNIEHCWGWLDEVTENE